MNHYNSQTAGMLQQFTCERHRAKGFTLVELLVVISIIGLLVAVAFTSVNGALASQRLSTASRQLSADLQNASMLARKENRPVEVRFYQVPPLDQPGDKAWRAYQVAVLDTWDASGNAKVVFQTEVQRLPNEVVIMPDATYNSLASLTAHEHREQNSPVNGAAYVSYFINGNGNTTLPHDKSAVLTLVRETPRGIPTSLPDDFRSIVIDPRTHQSRVY